VAECSHVADRGVSHLKSMSVQYDVVDGRKASEASTPSRTIPNLLELVEGAEGESKCLRISAGRVKGKACAASQSTTNNIIVDTSSILELVDELVDLYKLRMDIT